MHEVSAKYYSTCVCTCLVRSSPFRGVTLSADLVVGGKRLLFFVGTGVRVTAITISLVLAPLK